MISSKLHCFISILLISEVCDQFRSSVIFEKVIRTHHELLHLVKPLFYFSTMNMLHFVNS
jgi:hypothetical protein